MARNIWIILLLIFTMWFSNGYCGEVRDIGTGIIYPSSNGAIINNPAGLATSKGEHIEASIGSSRPFAIDGAEISYAGSGPTYGIGFAMGYLNGTFQTFAAGGIDARSLQIGVGAWFNNTTFTMNGKIGLIAEIEGGLTLGTTFTNIWDPTRNLTIAAGLERKDNYFAEVDLPISFNYFTFSPSVSLSLLIIRDITLNLGFDRMFAAYGGTLPSVLRYLGRLHGGVSYRFSSVSALSLLYNKDMDGIAIAFKVSYR